MGLSERIQELIKDALRNAKITSAGGESPNINTVFDVEFTTSPNLDDEIRSAIEGGDGEKKTGKFSTNSDNEDKISQRTKKKINDNDSKIKQLLGGNVGELERMTQEQFGNIRSLASDPFNFMMQGILRKLKSGLGILFIVTIAAEVIKFIIQELFKPGRIFDTRFREQIDRQIIQFLERKEQQELKQGFKNIITTTIGGLRGDSLRGQIGGNFFTPERIPARFIDPALVVDTNQFAQDARRKSQTISFGRSRRRRG